jgi:NAD+ diphosphatase
VSRSFDPAWPPLARHSLDRAAHRRRDEAWLAQAWRRARILVVDLASGARVLVTAEPDAPSLVLLEPDQAPPVGSADRLFLGVDSDGTPIFAVDAALPPLPEARPAALREIGHRLSDRDAGLFITAVALANWHARHPYSPATGQPTLMAEGGWTRVDEGGVQLWPRTDPAMIVLVHDGQPGPGGRCLLGNNAGWPAQRGVRRFSCLAGFVEPGESAEAAVAREVAEEVGLAVDEIEYQGSQAWPFPSSLMLGFFARADPRLPLELEPTEIAHARWFPRTELAAVLAGEPVDGGDGNSVRLPPPASIAHFLIARWLTR